MSPKKTPIINDFRAGELTPRTDAHPDLKDYYRGCRILEGMMPIIEGGVARVPGTYYVRPVKQVEEGWSLRVTKSGTGTGVVTSDVAGINCGASCYYFFPAGTTVILTATPDSGSSFAGWLGDGTGMVTRSVLMDGNKVVNAGFSAGDPYLIGWYKFDEGSGVVVHNYATDGVLGGGLLPNINILGDQGTFWDTNSGFGTTLPDYPDTYGYVTFTERSYLGGLGIFFKQQIDPTITLAMPVAFIGQFDEDLALYLRGNFIFGSDEYKAYFRYGSFVSYTSSHDPNYNEWKFLLIDDTLTPKIIRTDGTLEEVEVPFSDELSSFLFDTILIGAMYTPDIFADAGGCFGDLIIYNNKMIPISMPGDGYKPWSQWYDELRSRYGMAARSGW